MSNNGDAVKEEAVEASVENEEKTEKIIAFKIVEREVIVEGSRKAVLAGMGAVAVLQEGKGDWFNNLVERGEKVEQSGRDQLRKVADRPQKEIKRLGDGVGSQFDKMLAWLNVPTRTDIQNLNEKVTELTKKVEALQKSKTAKPEVAQPKVEEAAGE